MNPDYSKTYVELGNIFFDQQKFRGAIPQYRKALELDPEDAEALQKLGESYYRTQVYYSAYSQFQNLLKIEPNNAAASFMLGITAYKQAVLSELIEAFLELFDADIAAESKKRKNVSGNRKERQEVYREMISAFRSCSKITRRLSGSDL